MMVMLCSDEQSEVIKEGWFRKSHLHQILKQFDLGFLKRV